MLTPDLYIFFVGLGGNRYSRRRVAEYFMENFATLDKRFSASFGISHLIKYSLGTLTSKADLQKVQDFFKGKGGFINWSELTHTDVSRFVLTVGQVNDSIQASADWLERDLDDVSEWLKSNKYL